VALIARAYRRGDKRCLTRIDEATNFIEMLEFLEPDGIQPRGTLLVIPGRGEQGEVYKRFGSRIAADAYRVEVLSDPTADAEATRAEIEQRLQPLAAVHPLVLVGSDTGALFAAGLLANDELSGVTGAILAGLPVSADPAAATATATAGSWDEELEARTTCPTHRGHISAALVTPGALYQPAPQDWLERANLAAIQIPVLAIHGQEDPISSLDAARERYAPVLNLEFVSVAGARHDALNDQSHRSVAATVVLWLERLKLHGPELNAIATPELVGYGVA
jgi:alpha-beta hydrolase superfamily lysophospholipase